MAPRSDKKCCIEAEQAIRHAHNNHVPPIRHTCNDKPGRPKADLIPGHRLTEYCSDVLQGTGITPLVLVPTQQYAVCREMVRRLINPKLNNSDRDEAAGATNNNNNTNNAASNPGNTNAASDPPSVVGGIMLPGTSTGAIVPKQEAAAEIAVGNDRIIVHEYINRTNTEILLSTHNPDPGTAISGAASASNNTSTSTARKVATSSTHNSTNNTSSASRTSITNNTSASASSSTRNTTNASARKASSSSTRGRRKQQRCNNNNNSTAAAASSCVCSCPCNSCNNNNSTVDTVTEAASTTPYKPSNPRTPTQEKLLKDVKKANKQQSNKKPFHEYQHRGDSIRADIIRSFGVQIMAACSYSQLLNESGIDYIEKDCEFKMDCSVLLEEIAVFVGNKVKQNFSCTNFDNSLRYLPPGESLDAGTLVDRDIETISSLISDERTSHLLHCGLSDSSYNNVKSLVEERVGKHIKLLTPYMLRKGRLPMETQFLQKKHTHHDDAFEPEIDSDIDEVINKDDCLNETTEGKKKKSRRKKKGRGKGTNKQQPNKQKDNKKNTKKDKRKECAMEDIIHAMNRKENEKRKGIMCCSIKGGIKVCIHKMIEEIKKTDGTKIEGKFLFINSVDAANYSINKQTDTSVTSYNSQIWGNSVKQQIPSCSSHSVLTYQQTGCPEKIEYVLPALEVVWEDLKKMQEEGELQIEGCDIFPHELHDGKMLYLITQHSLWNRTNKPYLRCGCLRGEGVRNNNKHTCHMWSHEEEVNYYNAAAKQWKKYLHDIKYDLAKHRDWCDEFNEGITDLGAHPDLLRRTSIRFDIFHQSKSNTVQVIQYVRRIIFKQSTTVNELFEKFLGEECSWTSFSVKIFMNNKSMNIYDGKIINMVCLTAKMIGTWIEKNITKNDETKAIVKVLFLWQEIHTFLKKTDVDTNYEQEIVAFEKRVKAVYSHGKDLFLTNKETGDGETFYFHVLRYYMPQIARETYTDFGCGVGIWSMQAFERRNAEGKTIHRSMTNSKHNWIEQVMSRLLDNFVWLRYKDKDKKKYRKDKKRKGEEGVSDDDDDDDDDDDKQNKILKGQI